MSNKISVEEHLVRTEEVGAAFKRHIIKIYVFLAYVQWEVISSDN